MPKSAVRQAIVDALAQERDTLVRAALMAKDEATNEQSKAENKYDTRGQEAAYLAGTQAKLALELQEAIGVYQLLPLPDFASSDAIDIGALVQLRHKGRTQWVMVGPRNGGLEFTWEDRTIVVLTPQSPLGQRLIGRRAGDTIALPARTGVLTHDVISVE